MVYSSTHLGLFSQTSELKEKFISNAISIYYVGSSFTQYQLIAHGLYPYCSIHSDLHLVHFSLISTRVLRVFNLHASRIFVVLGRKLLGYNRILKISMMRTYTSYTKSILHMLRLNCTKCESSACTRLFSAIC